MTSSQIIQFNEHISNKDSLTLAIEWIKDNLDISDVFDQSDIENWCRKNSTPSDTFTDDQLDAWAIESGYTKGEQAE